MVICPSLLSPHATVSLLVTLVTGKGLRNIVGALVALERGLLKQLLVLLRAKQRRQASRPAGRPAVPTRHRDIRAAPVSWLPARLTWLPSYFAGWLVGRPAMPGFQKCICNK